MAKKNISRLKRNFPLLQSLKHSSPQQRKFILERASPDLIKTLADICYNIVHGNLRLSKQQKTSLQKHKKNIRRLADKKIKISTKRKEIVQKGGFISGLIPVISLAASLISGLLSK